MPPCNLLGRRAWSLRSAAGAPALPTHCACCLWAGLIPYKGVELLLRAVEIAARRCSIKLDIVGGADPVYKNYLLRIIQELRLESSVNFLAPVPRHQLPSLYQRADVFASHPVRHLRDRAAGGDALRLRGPGQRRGGRGRNRERGERTQGRLDTPDEYIREYAERSWRLLKTMNFGRVWAKGRGNSYGESMTGTG